MTATEEKNVVEVDLFIEVEACRQVEKELLSMLHRFHVDSEKEPSPLTDLKFQIVNGLCLNLLDKKRSVLTKIKAILQP